MRKNICVISCFRARRFTIKNVVCHININNMFETKIDKIIIIPVERYSIY